MIRVLHVGSGHMLGGLEAMLLTIAANSAAADMTASFAFAFDGPVVSRLRADGHPVQTLGGARLSRPLSILRARAALREVIRSRSPDVVVCHGAWSLALFGGVASRAGCPLAMWMHDVATDGPLPIVDRIARRVRPDLVLNNSRYTADAARRLFPHERMRVVYCPVEPPPPSSADARARVRAEHQADAHARVILQVGRWEPLKGQLVLLEALALLRDRTDWVCWQVGAPQRPHEHAHDAVLRARVASLALGERVRFLGWQREIGAVLAAADLYCQPNVGAEAFGITFIEAMYAKLPVIGPSIGGPAEIITPDVGATVAPGDAPALARAIERFLDDPHAMRVAGEAAPARARLLSDPQARMRDLAVELAALVSSSRAGAPSAQATRTPVRS